MCRLCEKEGNGCELYGMDRITRDLMVVWCCLFGAAKRCEETTPLPSPFILSTGGDKVQGVGVGGWVGG
jgi:hypothetical protein